jgi:hypothetical protein
VSWSGSDSDGPGIAGYDVYVSDDGGPFTLWQSDTTATSATYTGQTGHTYAFYSVATDNLGLVQPTSGSAQATTTVTNPPPPPPPPPPPAPVSVTVVHDEINKKHQVTEVMVTFSGAVNAAEARNPSIYRLTLPGKKGSYTAKNAKVIKIKSAGYDAADDTVTLIPSKPFALTKPVQLLIDGQPPSGLQDGSGRYIDGAHRRTPGSNAVAILSRGGAAVEAVAGGATGGQAVAIMGVVDALLEQDGFAGLTMAHRGRRDQVLARI